MQNLPVLFLLVLLASCSPAVTEVPGPTDAPITTNTPAPTATAPLPPSPTPTESPEQAAARLAQDVLDGTLTDLSSLDEQQRLAVIEILTEHIPEVAGMVIQNQDRYDEIVVPLPEPIQREVHLEMAQLINNGRTINPNYKDKDGRLIGLDTKTNEWVLLEVPDEYVGKYIVPTDVEVIKEPIPSNIFLPARTITDGAGEIIGYEMYNKKTQEWENIDLSKIMSSKLPIFTSDLTNHSALEGWLNITGRDGTQLLNNFNTMKGHGGVFLTGMVIGDFNSSLPIPTSSKMSVKLKTESLPALVTNPFRSMVIGYPYFEGDYLMGFIKIHAFVDSRVPIGLVPSDGVKRTGSVMQIDSKTEGYTRYVTTWNTQEKPFEGFVTIFLEDPKGFSSSSSNSARENEPFLPEMISMQEFLRICSEGQCNLITLKNTKSSLFAFGAWLIVTIE
jgi:hypothetical protein